jgi:hypothetical protein
MYISESARVYGNARVYGKARVYGNAQVSGDARVYGKARVYGDAWVSGYARVYGNAQVSGDARVYGKARVYGILRSDGHVFAYVPCADGLARVIAGCRYFTMPEAIAHWDRDDYRDQNLRAETMVILDCLVRLAAVKPGNAV